MQRHALVGHDMQEGTASWLKLCSYSSGHSLPSIRLTLQPLCAQQRPNAPIGHPLSPVHCRQERHHRQQGQVQLQAWWLLRRRVLLLMRLRQALGIWWDLGRRRHAFNFRCYEAYRRHPVGTQSNVCVYVVYGTIHAPTLLTTTQQIRYTALDS